MLGLGLVKSTVPSESIYLTTKISKITLFSMQTMLSQEGMELGFLSVFTEVIFWVLLVFPKFCDPKENSKESFSLSLSLVFSVSY